LIKKTVKEDEARAAMDEVHEKGDQDVVVFRNSQSSVMLKNDGSKKTYEVKVYANTITRAAKLASKIAKELDKS